jgi:protein-S-isoprenylcysteine O-methyltransferase Ste14
MFEVRFESTDGVRWRAGWWLATIGAAFMALGVIGAVVAPQISQSDSEGVIYFGIGVVAATIGFAAFIVGRNLMFRRIVSRVGEEDDSSDG